MFDDFKGKSVLVTGSSTGIGAAVARGFAAAGAKVAVHGNSSKTEAEKVVANIRTAGGTAILTMGDVMKTEVVGRIIHETVDAFGGLDVLINNAGSLFHRAAVEQQDDELYDNVTDLNIRSVVSACRIAVPHLKKAKGCIINTGSIAGHNGGAVGAGLYAGAKAFVHSWTRTMAIELGPDGIRVNCVSPGVILTPFHERFSNPEKLEGIRATIPLRRLGVAEDCVGIYLFLASEKMAGYIHGQVIEINGGQYFK
ncbi:SDR family NAD(P)-dependent oxidoreductase [Shumkonia mesophila]|uniref:SDR family NAD(P)-dependent oxidoreductase n=1 Tax=Shumkonia mesophila TaxID=2838854 RepID=UPI002934EBDB|nr:SDR family oxidoreductase [Shumkonia mesophila]